MSKRIFVDKNCSTGLYYGYDPLGVEDAQRENTLHIGHFVDPNDDETIRSLFVPDHSLLKKWDGMSEAEVADLMLKSTRRLLTKDHVRRMESMYLEDCEKGLFSKPFLLDLARHLKLLKVGHFAALMDGLGLVILQRVWESGTLRAAEFFSQETNPQQEAKVAPVKLKLNAYMFNPDSVRIPFVDARKLLEYYRRNVHPRFSQLVTASLDNKRPDEIRIDAERRNNRHDMNQLIDAWLLYQAEKELDCDYFLTMDYKLCRKLEQSNADLGIRLVTPCELLIEEAVPEEGLSWTRCRELGDMLLDMEDERANSVIKADWRYALVRSMPMRANVAIPNEAYRPLLGDGRKESLLMTAILEHIGAGERFAFLVEGGIDDDEIYLTKFFRNLGRALFWRYRGGMSPEPLKRVAVLSPRPSTRSHYKRLLNDGYTEAIGRGRV